MKHKKSLLGLAVISAMTLGVAFAMPTHDVFAEEEEECTTLTVNDVCAVDYYELKSLINSNKAAGIKDNLVTLRSDIVDPTTTLLQFPSSVNITIDFNGHTINTGQSWLVYGTKLTLTGNGRVIFSKSFPINFIGHTAPTSNFSVLTVGPGIELEGTYNGVWDMMSMAYTTGDYPSRKYGVVINFDGKVIQTRGQGRTFYINGTYGDTNTIINYGPTAYANTDSGMYVAAGATVNYYGVMETNVMGVEIRGGQFNMYSGSITVDANKPYSLRSNPKNGAAAEGTALTVTQHTTKLPISVNIYGGSLIADKPLVEMDAVGNGDASYETVTGSISGGNFYSTSDKDTVEVSHWTEFITGGDYTPARLEQTYIHPLYEDEEINTEYWRVYPREVDLNGKTIKDEENDDVASTVELGTAALADRKYPVEFTTMGSEKIATLQEENPNVVAGTSIKILRDNGDDVVISEDNAVTLSLGVTGEQYQVLKNFDRLYAHFLDDDGVISEIYPAELTSRYYDGEKYYMVRFNIMGLGTAQYLISGEIDPRDDDSPSGYYEEGYFVPERWSEDGEVLVEVWMPRKWVAVVDSQDVDDYDDDDAEDLVIDGLLVPDTGFSKRAGQKTVATSEFSLTLLLVLLAALPLRLVHRKARSLR